MDSALETFIRSWIRSGEHCGETVGDACIGTLYVDLTFERNCPTTLDDARAFFASMAIAPSDEDIARLAELLTPVTFNPKGTPSYVYLIGSLNYQGFVDYKAYATKADHAKAWARCIRFGRAWECSEAC